MITVFGAGSIGCHVGGLLAAAGTPVTLIGRPGLAGTLARGFTVAPLGGAPRPVPMEMITVAAALDGVADPGTLLVCVKSGDTRAAAETIRDHAPLNSRVISLQNGVTNVPLLAGVLGAERVVAGMVGFNVVRPAPGAFVQATEGGILLGPGGAALAGLLDGASVTARVHRNMTGVQWSKLLMNLNNALNALSGLGLRAQLQDRAWRRVLAGCIGEGLALARAEGIPLARAGKVPPQLMPPVLRLPDPLFSRLAGAMLRIDASARSSMADDYRLGRPPEVDWLNGFIADRCRARGLPHNLNARVTELVHEAFADPARPPLAMPASAISA